VKGYNEGKEVANDKLITSREPATLIVVADKKRFRTNRENLVHLEVFIKDAKGNPVYEATNEITVDIKGPAVLLGLESGDITSHEDYKANKRKAFNGRLLAYVLSTGTGKVTITISSPGLPAVVKTITY
jgi:hypothetical protein